MVSNRFHLKEMEFHRFEAEAVAAADGRPHCHPILVDGGRVVSHHVAQHDRVQSGHEHDREQVTEDCGGCITARKQCNVLLRIS